jgi:BASS family bile acid:Na+ symporter
MNPFDFFIANEFIFAATQLTLAMLGMGATLTPGDFKEVVRDPRGFTTGAVIQVILVPLACYLFIIGFTLPAGVAIGLALCAAIPGGTISNIFTFFARGHVALSIAITAITTLLCLVSVPIVLDLLVDHHLPGEVAIPAGKIALEILLYLLLPLAVGMVVLDRAPRLAPTVSKWAIRLSLFIILLIVIGALGAGRLDMDTFGVQNALVVWAFIVAICALSIGVSRAMRLDWPDTAAINIEVVLRNVNLGILIKASLFPAIVGVADPIGDMIFFTLIFYGAAQMAFSGVFIYFYRRIIGADISTRADT